MSVRRLYRHLRRPLVLASLGALVPFLVAGGTVAAAPSSPRLPASSALAISLAPVKITATAAVLMDVRSGQVLYSRNPDLAWPPASTTKIMTALVALESGSLDQPILISDRVARFRVGTNVGLPAGARIPLRDLLYALMLKSGNDAALAVAEGVAGSVPEFVARMNAAAQRLGAQNTHFTSPHGLYDRDHISTAHDLAVITRAALQNPMFREIVKARYWAIKVPGHRQIVLFNHNRLLARFTGADGVKTGFVRQAGHTLVASATRDGWQLIAVVLHPTDLWGDASRLLSYGFTHYRSVELAGAGEEIGSVEVPGAVGPVPGMILRPVFGVLEPGENPVRRVSALPGIEAPVRQGELVGKLEVFVSDRLVASAPLVAARDVQAHADIVRMIEWVAQFAKEAVQ